MALALECPLYECCCPRPETGYLAVLVTAGNEDEPNAPFSTTGEGSIICFLCFLCFSGSSGSSGSLVFSPIFYSYLSEEGKLGCCGTDDLM